jgi:hypothetical protein
MAAMRELATGGSSSSSSFLEEEEAEDGRRSRETAKQSCNALSWRRGE